MAANVQGLCHSFLKELLQGVHSFCQDGAGNVTPLRSAAGQSDTIKGALYSANNSMSPGTVSAYSATGEVTNSSGTGYTAAGQPVTFAAGQAITNGNSGVVTPSANLQWSALTISTAFDTLLLYNSSQGNRAVALYNFGSQTITAGTLTLTMPANVAGTALIELAGTA